MQLTKVVIVLSGLALVCARPSASIRSSLVARVEECSCDDADNAFNVCLLETCGHGCDDTDTPPCVAAVGMYIKIFECGALTLTCFSEAECSNNVTTCAGFPTAWST